MFTRLFPKAAEKPIHFCRTYHSLTNDISLTTYVFYVCRAFISRGFYWDIFVFIKIDPGVGACIQFPITPKIQVQDKKILN